MNLCKKGGGVPIVPSWVIREYQDILAKPLRVIFQASIDMGIIPKSMKVAKITPIPKVKNPTSVSDYRPINCTSPFLKILERIVHLRWLTLLITYSNFSDQFAFIPLRGRGCTSALTLICLETFCL